MADRRPKLIFDAISAIPAATSFCATASLLQYQQDLMLRSAVERQLEILGEACTRLLREHNTLVDELPEARLAIGLRNRIIHGYDNIDDETVFNTVTQDLARFEAGLRRWLHRLDPNAPELPS